MTKLTPEAFDSLTRVHVREERIIWTAKAIGSRIGRSETYVRKTLANEIGGPVKRRGKRLYVVERDLIEYLRTGGS